jgi:hypothetical protein
MNSSGAVVVFDPWRRPVSHQPNLFLFLFMPAFFRFYYVVLAAGVTDRSLRRACCSNFVGRARRLPILLFSVVLNFAFGRMLGFHFPKNFDLSYRVRSITEF